MHMDTSSKNLDFISLAPRNVVLLFDNDLTDEFISLSNLINQKIPSKVVLNRINTHPHLTVYTTNYPERNLAKVTDTLGKLVKNTQSFALRFTGKSIVVGTIFIDAELSPELYALHEKVVDSLNPLRDGLFDEKEMVLPGFTEEMKTSLQQYGMWAAKKLYVPHTTIARPVDSTQYNEALRLLPDKINYKTKIKSISFVERGPNGTCKRILQTFPLISN